MMCFFFGRGGGRQPDITSHDSGTAVFHIDACLYFSGILLEI